MHLTPYITDIFGSIQTVVAAAKGQKEKIDGIHAGLGIADYAAITLLDNDKPAMNSMDCSAWSDAAIAAKLEECCPCVKEGSGVGAIDWSKVFSDVWGEVKPMVWQLLQRWLFS